jgi:hypothetical protein
MAVSPGQRRIDIRKKIKMNGSFANAKTVMSEHQMNMLLEALRRDLRRETENARCSTDHANHHSHNARVL